MFFGGCLDGNPCSDGLICGIDAKDKAYNDTTLQECKKYAEDTNSYAFSYRSTGGKWCRLCDEANFGNRQTTSNPWGVFLKPTQGKNFAITQVVKQSF